MPELPGAVDLRPTNVPISAPAPNVATGYATDAVTALGAVPTTQPVGTPAGFAEAAWNSGATRSPYLMAPTTIFSNIPASIMSAEAGAVQVLGNAASDVSTWWQSSLLNPLHDVKAIGGEIDSVTAKVESAAAGGSSLVKWAVIGAIAIFGIKILGLLEL